MTETQIFLIVIFALALTVLSIPFIRFILKRIILVFKLKKLCNKGHLKLYRSNPFWFFGRKNGANCDFYLESEENIYSIKLFNVPKRSYMLVFTEDFKYFFRKILVIRGKSYNNDGKQRSMKSYNFRYKFRNEWELKKLHNILLIHPVCFEIHNRKLNGPEKLLGTSDMINGMSIYSLSRLIGHLETNNNAKEN